MICGTGPTNLGPVMLDCVHLSFDLIVLIDATIKCLCLLCHSDIIGLRVECTYYAPIFENTGKYKSVQPETPLRIWGQSLAELELKHI